MCVTWLGGEGVWVAFFLLSFDLTKEQISDMRSLSFFFFFFFFFAKQKQNHTHQKHSLVR